MTTPAEENPWIVMKKPAWWNLVGRYRRWKLLRDIKSGIYVWKYYVPGEDDDHAN